jgi:SagB-type dehydrogenase family enzyme
MIDFDKIGFAPRFAEQTADEHNIVEIFHENTKYWPSSKLWLLQPILAFLNDPKVIERQSRGYNHDPSLKRITLSRVVNRDANFYDVLDSRRSVRKFTGEPIALETLGSMLHAALAAKRTGTSQIQPKATFSFRSYPSGGALYPVEFYVVLLLSDFPTPCIAHYNPRAHELGVIDENVDRRAIEAAFTNPTELAGASMLVVATAVFQRSTAKYNARGYRFTLLEAGHAMQNLCLAVSAHGLGGCLCGGYYDDALNKLIGADGVTESVVSVLVIGKDGGGEAANG